MSHINKTQYYELPQYVGSDIINPLVDTNGAYEKIDTALHNIATEAGEGTSAIAALQNKVGSGNFDTSAQNATDAVNEVEGELNAEGTGVKARLTTVEGDVSTLQSQMVTAQGNITDLQNNKANQSEVNAALALKANQSDVDNINSLITTSHVFKELHRVVAAKLDSGDTIDALFDRLKTTIENYLSSLPNNTYAISVAMGFGNGWEGSCRISKSSMFTNSDYSLDTHFIDAVLTVLEPYDVRFYEGRFGSQKKMLHCKLESGTVTFTNELATEPTVGAYVDFMVFGNP